MRPAGGPRARLNVFQKTQRLWDAIHPYNATQAMEWAGPVSRADASAAFGHAIGDLGLGRFVCSGDDYSIERSSDVPAVVEAGGLESHASREMNAPFPAGEGWPFRPFLVGDAGRTYVGLTYQHWLADSVSVRLLMRQWLLRLTGRGGPAPVRLPAGGLLRYFGPAAGWSPLAQAATLVGFASRMKAVRRTPAAADGRVAVLVRRGRDGLVDAIKHRAKAERLTVGDVMLAAATEACVRHGSAEPTRQRPDAAMGTIVDLRARGGRLPGNVFGLFLGFTMTTFAAADLGDAGRLLARVSRERRTGLARRAAEASQFNIAIGYHVARRLRRDRLLTFYRKRFPLGGGLSSVNMTPGWAGDHHPTPLAGYHRVSPTGPLLPVVLTPTTLGPTLGVCCTYKTALLSSERAEKLVSAFLQQLQSYAVGRHT